MQKLPSTWSELKYCSSEEWSQTQEKLDALTARGTSVNPDRSLLFAALSAVPPDKVRVAILGQDPYPTREHASGIAFSVPASIRPEAFPASLKNIFKEYCSDLHYPSPTTGDLSTWCRRGVLAWNTYPTCVTGQPGSHHWNGWYTLTREIVETLDVSGNVVFVLLGQHARSLSRYIVSSPVVETSHPSPLGAKHGFLGSRLFTTVNTKLAEINRPTVDWRLEDGTK